MRAACPRRRYTNRRFVEEAWPRLITGPGEHCPSKASRAERGRGSLRLAALVQPAAFECDNLPARLRLRHDFGELFGNSEQALAPIHLLPYVLGAHASR